MKKLPRLIALRNVLLTSILLFVFTHCDESFQKTEVKTIEVSAITEGLKAFIGDGNVSMKNVSDFLSKEYNIDFEAEYKKLKPKFVVGAETDKDLARTKEIDLAGFQDILNNNGITDGSYSYDYLTRLSNVFENGVYEEWETQNMINQMRDEITNNYAIPAAEKSNLLSTWDGLTINYSGLVQVAHSINNGEVYAVARTQGWFKNAWRVVRSVILTAAVGALVGATAGPVGLVIGAIVMGAVAITDAALNDYCHFAMQCDGGWRQECSTGQCAPYVI